jgi:hypothetical protein
LIKTNIRLATWQKGLLYCKVLFPLLSVFDPPLPPSIFPFTSFYILS